MNVNVSNTDGNLVLKPEGRLDSFTAGDFEEVINKELNEDVKSLTIDLEKVDFVSSKGIRVLVSTYKNMNGREMKIEGANNSIKEVLKLSGLAKIFNIE